MLCAISAQAATIYTVTPLNVPNGVGNAINNSGEIAGATGVLPPTAFLYSNGVVKYLGALPTTFFSKGLGVNDAGQVTGSSWTGMNVLAFVYSNGVLRQVGGNYTQAYGINTLGQVTGLSASHAFLYSNDMVHDLGTLGGAFSMGRGINDSGQVTGESLIANNTNTHAFLYSGGVMRDLGTLPSYTDSHATAINNAGQVTGYSTGYSPVPCSPTPACSVTYRAFVYSNGQMYDIGTLYGASSGLAMNTFGQVVGSSGGSAFLYSNGVMINLNNVIGPSLVTLTSANGINDSGQIVANGVYSPSGPSDVFLLTPIPLPPAINDVSASPNSLWPPNNNFVDVTIGYTTVSISPATCALSVSSNEPGDGEWQILDQRHVLLHAARNGNGAGRIYTVTIGCANAAGNATANTLVMVPHDQSEVPSARRKGGQ
jgi:probable HAF family extracellular repeat protein